jgi:hypothetical protein
MTSAPEHWFLADISFLSTMNDRPGPSDIPNEVTVHGVQNVITRVPKNEGNDVQIIMQQSTKIFAVKPLIAPDMAAAEKRLYQLLHERWLTDKYKQEGLSPDNIILRSISSHELVYDVSIGTEKFTCYVKLKSPQTFDKEIEVTIQHSDGKTTEVWILNQGGSFKRVE